jgi:hypothetical protein
MADAKMLKFTDRAQAYPAKRGASERAILPGALPAAQ